MALIAFGTSVQCDNCISGAIALNALGISTKTVPMFERCFPDTSSNSVAGGRTLFYQIRFFFVLSHITVFKSCYT